MHLVIEDGEAEAAIAFDEFDLLRFRTPGGQTTQRFQTT